MRRRRLSSLAGISAGLCLALLALAAGRLAADDEVPADPDAQLKLAREFKDRNTPAIDALLKEPSPARRAEAVRKFLSAAPEDTPCNPVILDLDAAVCSPSPRLMLLDRIGAGDALDKADAIAISRSELDAKAPEERIVAARNLARLSPADRPGIRKRLRAIVRDAPGGGSFAFGQALDGMVYLRDTGAVPLLVRLMKDANLAPVAGATLDRLAAADPQRMAAWMNGHFSVLDGFPLLRADYYAKGSLASPDGRRLLEAYLQRPGVDDKEIEKFLFSYLQGGMFLVSGIFTGASQVPSEEGPDRAAELRAAAAAWRDQPKMARVLKAQDRVWELLSADPPEDAQPR